MKVRLVQLVSQSKGGRSERLQRVIDWPHGLSLPRPGDFLALSDDEGTVQDVNYTPLDANVAIIRLSEATAEGSQTAAEWSRENRPDWSIR